MNEVNGRAVFATAERNKAATARRRSAELHSAVSQNCILPRSAKVQALGTHASRGEWRIRLLRTFVSPAECNSAIRQNTILRYAFGHRHAGASFGLQDGRVQPGAAKKSQIPHAGPL